MGRGEGGYTGASPVWVPGGNPYLPGAWQIQEVYDRAKRGEWGFFDPLPSLGDAYQGGFFAGLISHTADGNPTHGLIVAPRATGATGTGYTLTTNLQWKTSATTTVGTTSPFDGAANTANMPGGTHPAAGFCTGLSIGGYSDWYLPARYELDIAYENLKPDTTANSTSWGINEYSVPERTVNRTSGDPAQTSLAAFQTGGAEAFVAVRHWSSTEFSDTLAWFLNFFDGTQNVTGGKNDLNRVRAFRKFAL
jgi:hypothetical protein